MGVIKIKFNTSVCLLVVLCCTLYLTSCNRLKEGKVVEKWHEPTRTYVTLMPLIIPNGKTTTTVMIPYIITDYEDWCVKIKGEHGGEERVEVVYVSQRLYECLPVGSYLKLTNECSVSDNNNQKVRQ